MQKTNDLLRHLSDDEDYILYIDKVTWDNIEKEDRVRLIRHELSHTDVDIDSNTNPYKIRGHELEDFYDEIEYNREDPRWAERCAEIALSIYERE